MTDIIADIVAEGERIEREKSGKALTPDEMKTLKAIAFLRRIAPYAVPSSDSDDTPR